MGCVPFFIMTIDFHLDFYFITKCMNKYVEEIATKVKTKKMPAPDIIFMNSLLWDVTRWGPDGVSKYRDNMVKLMKLLKSSLPPETLFVWTTAPPVSQHCYGGTLIKQIEFLRHTLRFEVMEANMYTRDVVGVHGFHVLDLHYYFRMQMILRAKDGVHWLAPAVRFMTNLLLTHVTLSLDHPLPGNFEGSLLGEMKELMELHSEEFMPVALPRLPLSLVLKDPELTATSPQVTAIVRSPLCKPPVPRNPRQKWKKKTRQTKNNDKENMLSCAVPRLKTHEYQPLLSLNCEGLQSARPLQYTNKMDGSTNFAWSSSLVANVNKYGAGSANHSTGNWTAASCHNASLVTQRYRQMSDMLVVAIEDEIAARVQSRNACETAGASQEQWWSDSYAPPDSSWNPPKYSSRHRRRPMPY
ncbi:PC-esterase domain-containing protein 1B-like isoform X2 [Bacillus rossius redtenbacheri]|uniref:PC-esterase domain-containing protein 1B-like isoform X2 n=1 Tax=Bacillus rossius redtenbacheri TaxID=93214 RepID=UPI002FDE0449